MKGNQISEKMSKTKINCCLNIKTKKKTQNIAAKIACYLLCVLCTRNAVSLRIRKLDENVLRTHTQQ